MFDEFDKLLKTFGDKYTINTTELSDGINFWRGKPIISAEQWLKITKANTISSIDNYNVAEGLLYYPATFTWPIFPLGIPDEFILEANEWRANWHQLLEYKHDEEYRKFYYPTEEEKANDPQAKF